MFVKMRSLSWSISIRSLPTSVSGRGRSWASLRRRPVAVLVGRAPALGEFPGLVDPLVAHGAAAEIAQVLVDPLQVHFGPGGDLVEMPDPHGMQHRLELRPDAPDELQVVRLCA